MSKRKRLHHKLADKMVSILVLAVFLIPIYFTFKWFAGLVPHPDTRSAKTSIVAFGTRGIDKTKEPLKPFKQPVVTISFDDGWESVYTNAFDDLQYEGLHSTQFIITDTFNDRNYMSKAQLHSMQSAGTEIASHTVTHPNLTQLDLNQLTHELRDSRQTLTNEFGPIKDFTAPYGEINSTVEKEVSRYYRSQKNAEGYISQDGLGSINIAKGFDPYNYKSYSVRKTTTMDDLKKLLADNQKYNGWLVLTYHQVDDSGEEYSVKPDVFYKQLRLISDSRSRSATVGQFMDALYPNWKPEQ